eukprot:gnl/MRDRNA2_/MRDRNA2_212641_c0_seq1.p1 gnl/MRDRNA2_/MRDRNA2_212641_c0~~gnl/MRDRNA2_/MRDRNA2_212641_c0_seq1.p1  ORF type:complete len:579 (+),score=111.22 gnl/MRDRNA2_/MRDRNA2_212641_c0_seq1:233-1738(+)
MLVLMNLITAMIVENARETAKNNEDEQLHMLKEQKHRWLSKLKKIFESLDSDDSGALTEDEFHTCLEHEDLMEQFALLGFDETEVETMFRDLDNGDGFLSVEEFIGGVNSLTGPAMNKELIRTQKSVERLHRRFDSLFELFDPQAVNPATKRQNLIARGSRQSISKGARTKFNIKAKLQAANRTSNPGSERSQISTRKTSSNLSSVFEGSPSLQPKDGDGDDRTVGITDDSNLSSVLETSPRLKPNDGDGDDRTVAVRIADDIPSEPAITDRVGTTPSAAESPLVKPCASGQSMLQGCPRSSLPNPDVMHPLVEALKDQLKSQLIEMKAYIAEICAAEAKAAAVACRKKNECRAASGSPNEAVIRKTVSDHVENAKLEIAEICRVYLSQPLLQTGGLQIWSQKSESMVSGIQSPPPATIAIDTANHVTTPESAASLDALLTSLQNENKALRQIHAMKKQTLDVLVAGVADLQGALNDQWSIIENAHLASPPQSSRTLEWPT